MTNVRLKMSLFEYIVSIVLLLGLWLPSFADDQPPYGSFRSKIGDIKDAVRNYDYYGQTRLTGLIVDTNMPSEIYCGEQYNIFIKVAGNYEDEKGNTYKRSIIDPVVIVEAPNFVISKRAEQNNGVEYTIAYPTAPLTMETKTVFNINTTYGGQTVRRAYEIIIVPRPKWADWPGIGIYKGSYDMYTIDLCLLMIEPVVIYGDIYIRNNFNYDQNIMGEDGIEVGPRIYSKQIYGGFYSFCGINLGFSEISSGVGFMFGPASVERNSFYAPYIGLMKKINRVIISGIAEKYVYNSKSFDSFKIGVSL